MIIEASAFLDISLVSSISIGLGDVNIGILLQYAASLSGRNYAPCAVIVGHSHDHDSEPLEIKGDGEVTKSWVFPFNRSNGFLRQTGREEGRR